MSAQFFTVEGLASLYKIPINTIRKKIRNGDFKNVLKIGRSYRISEESRLEFERKNQVNR